MSDRTTYFENAMVNQILNGTAFTFPPEVYVALITAVTSSEAGTFDEVTGGTYSRVTGAFSAPLDGQASNSVDLTFAQATAEWGTVSHYALMDSGSGGNPLTVSPVGTGDAKVFTVTDGDLFTVPSHSFANAQQAELKAALGLTLPVGSAEDTRYWFVSASGDNFRLAASEGGVPIDFGSGAGWIRRIVPRPVLIDDKVEFGSGSLTYIAG